MHRLDAEPKSLAKELHTHLQAILDVPDLGTVRLLLNQTLKGPEHKAPRAKKLLIFNQNCDQFGGGVCVEDKVKMT